MNEDVFKSWTLEELPEQFRENYEITSSGEEGFYSCREKFRVVCKKCKAVLHHSTTNPTFYIEWHAKECQ